MKAPPSTRPSATLQSWTQIKQSDQYRGLWVALDECRYDARTAQPLEGAVVDADEDLVALCSRMQTGESRHCAILFCDLDDPLTPVAPMTSPAGSTGRLSSAPPSGRHLSH